MDGRTRGERKKPWMSALPGSAFLLKAMAAAVPMPSAAMVTSVASLRLAQAALR
jgi:hypothetical protein